MILDLEKFKHPRHNTSDRLLIEDVLRSGVKTLSIIHNGNPCADGQIRFQIEPGFYLEIIFSLNELYLSIRQHNPETYSSTLLGDLKIQFNENGIIPMEYNLVKGLIYDHIEDNIDEVAYAVICKNSAVYNIFHEIYYIIEARHCMNTILFKGES
jgi:hypothetical protein